ncbi:MAG: ABC transporter permease [Bacillota bacterium]|jgi:hypothetical protein
MRRIFSLLGQDLRLLLRNAIFWVVSVSLVLIVITVRFLLPADSQLPSNALVTHGLDLAGAERLDSPAAVEAQVRERGAIGLIMEDGTLTVVHSGWSEQAVAALVTQLTPPDGQLPAITTQVLRQSTGDVPRNLRMMPVFISFEAVVLGFLMAAILLLGEKQEAVLRAYRVSPGGTWAYLASKSLLFICVGTVYALLMAVLTLGFSFHAGQFVLLTALACLFYTLLGLSVAAFFEDISGWFAVAVLILSLNMLPMFSYVVPTFSPAWMQLIPSYGGLFAYEEILFPTGKSLQAVYLTLGAWTLAALGLCSLVIKRQLLTAK